MEKSKTDSTQGTVESEDNKINFYSRDHKLAMIHISGDMRDYK